MAEKSKKKRVRSPNYPLVNLSVAVEAAQVLFDHDKRHPVPILIAHDRWKYKRGSSAANQCTAALKSYGLIDIQGKGDGRKLAVTEAGERIVRDAPDRAERLQKAALSPSIHAELWSLYREKGLPSDDVIEAYLVWDREGACFNDDIVGGVIRRFRETIAFANVRSRDIMEDDDPVAEDDWNSAEGPGVDPSGHKAMPEINQPKDRKTGVSLQVLESDGSIRVVNVPYLSEQAFDFLKNQLDTYKAAIVKQLQPEKE